MNQRQKWVMVGIGGGGGKAAADFILYSRYLRHVVSSVYFLNTAGEDLRNLEKTRLEKAFQNQWIRAMGEDFGKKGIPIDFIRFAFFGTGNNFVRSQELFEKYIIQSQEFSGRMEPSVIDSRMEPSVVEEPLEKPGIQIKEKSGYDLSILESLSKNEEKKTDLELSDEEESPVRSGGLRNFYNDLIGAQNVILVHSLGGGTGGGSAPILARWVRDNAGYEDREPTVISVCFLASKMDGPLRMANSLHNLMKISREADIVLLFSNEILLSGFSGGKTEDKQDGDRYLQINEKIVKAIDVLLSPTAVSELGGQVSVEFDPHNLKTYLRMIFDDGGTPFPVNVAVPFVSVEEEKNLAAPVAFNYALGSEQVPIYQGSLMSLVPFFLSSSLDMGKEEFHHENLELYDKQIEVKGLQENYKLELESVTGIADSEYRKSSKNIDVLILGLAKLNFEDYEEALESPRVQVKWAEFLGDKQETSDRFIQRVREWIDKYNQKVDEFNNRMAEYKRRS
jgi:hypothetical protein